MESIEGGCVIVIIEAFAYCSELTVGVRNAKIGVKCDEQLRKMIEQV